MAMGDKPRERRYHPAAAGARFFFFLLSKMRELAIANDRLMQVASTDGLTSCLSRAAFTTLVDAYLEFVSKDQKQGGALLILDVDHFKSVNDRFGHDQGDHALRIIVQNIKETVRDIDLVGRMGGEEFGVFLPGLSLPGTASVAERIRQAVASADFQPDGSPHPLSVSIGAVTFSQRPTFLDLYKLADRNLYVAKDHGRNRIELTAFELGQLQMH
jgi:diguanylate cyclase (GGDEF)-like protein